jgi:hypothetical protein
MVDNSQPVGCKNSIIFSELENKFAWPQVLLAYEAQFRKD